MAKEDISSKQQDEGVDRDAQDPLQQSQVISQDLDFNEADLEVVEISDDGLAVVDETSKAARKQAKKTAKKLRSPEEIKQLKRKKIIIGLCGAGAALLVLLAVPLTRWAILNFIGLRGDLTIRVVDEKSATLLTKATIKLDDGSFGQTNAKGTLIFANTKLGKRKVSIQKSGYADVTTTLTNGIGSTKPTIKLRAIGIKLDVDVKNWLSGKVIESATVTYKSASAISDKTGRASLIIPPTDAVKVKIRVSATGFLDKETETDVDVASREVALVSAAKNYFISKRDGKFDIFSANLDGTNQQKIIEATGKEDEGLMQLSINRNNKQAILVANRDGKLTNNKVVAGVYLIDLEKSSIKKIDEGSDVQLINWSDNSMVYTKTVPDLNYDDPALSRLMNLNISNNKLTELAQTNYFQIAVMAQNKIYYLPADAYRTLENNALSSLDVISNAKKTYFADKTLRYAVRASFGTLELQDTAGTNYELQIANGATKAIDHRPSSALLFSSSPDGQAWAWNDRRDGQGALLGYSIKDSAEKTIAKAGGLTSPVRFINDDLVIVRVVTSQETADYVVSLMSGKMSKVVDVSNIGTGYSGNL